MLVIFDKALTIFLKEFIKQYCMEVVNNNQVQTAFFYFVFYKKIELNLCKFISH